MQNLLESELITNNGKIPLNPFLIGERREQDILFLVISDLHMDHKKLEKLKGWHKDYNNDLIDFVLILGDFDNLDNNSPGSVDVDLCSQSEARITNLLNFLEFFSCPIMIIPGNHDPSTLFEENKKYPNQNTLTQHAYNLHKREYAINKTLSLLGFGGSLPGYKDWRGKKEQIWEGFPFHNEEDLQLDSAQFFKSHFEQSNSGKQYLLLTHMGPMKSSTTQIKAFTIESETIYSGAEYFDKVIGVYGSQIVANIHGHTHDSVGKDTINKVPIINPGSIIDGNFLKLALTKDSASGNWGIRSIQFLNLNSF